jgi:hypothetical protein
MWRDEQANTNTQETEQTNKQKFQVQEQQNFSLILSSGVTPPASNLGVVI